MDFFLQIERGLCVFFLSDTKIRIMQIQTVSVCVLNTFSTHHSVVLHNERFMFALNRKTHFYNVCALGSAAFDQNILTLLTFSCLWWTLKVDIKCSFFSAVNHVCYIYAFFLLLSSSVGFIKHCLFWEKWALIHTFCIYIFYIVEMLERLFNQRKKQKSWRSVWLHLSSSVIPQLTSRGIRLTHKNMFGLV